MFGHVKDKRMMQGVKISWVGRSFALAGASDSSGRHKGGKRKTKDERRIMIELFVEKYSSLACFVLS